MQILKSLVWIDVRNVIIIMTESWSTNSEVEEYRMYSVLLQFTVVLDRKLFVGLERLVTIGNHVSADISVTRHPEQPNFLPLVRYT